MPTSRSALPLGALGMALLIAAIELFAIKGNPCFQTIHGMSWQFAGRMSTRATRGNGVLCFGDSLAKFGIVPWVLHLDTQRQAFNLATHAGPSPTSYFLLRRALAAGARPSTIVVDFASTLLHEGPGSRVLRYPWSHLLSFREGAELAWVAGDASLFARIAVEKLFPTIRTRHEVRSYVLGALQGERIETARRVSVDALLRAWSKNRGAQPATPRPDRIIPRYERPAIASWVWRCHPVNLVYLQKFLALAEANAIPVAWILPPLSPTQQRLDEETGNDARYEAFVRKTKREFPGITVVDGRHSHYGERLFIDEAHVDVEGAKALTGGLAQVLRGSRSAPGEHGRWERLPDYRPRPEVTVEDFQLSVALVQFLSRGERR